MVTGARKKPIQKGSTGSRARLAEATSPSPSGSVAPGKAKVVWDDTNLRTTYANVCKMQGTRDEIALSFGSNQSWQMGQEQVCVLLTDRIVLNPHSAKRLLVMLEQGMRDYETRFGRLEV